MVLHTEEVVSVPEGLSYLLGKAKKEIGDKCLVVEIAGENAETGSAAVALFENPEVFAFEFNLYSSFCRGSRKPKEYKNHICNMISSANPNSVVSVFIEDVSGFFDHAISRGILHHGIPNTPVIFILDPENLYQLKNFRERSRKLYPSGLPFPYYAAITSDPGRNPHSSEKVAMELFGNPREIGTVPVKKRKLGGSSFRRISLYQGQTKDKDHMYVVKGTIGTTRNLKNSSFSGLKGGVTATIEAENEEEAMESFISEKNILFLSPDRGYISC